MHQARTESDLAEALATLERYAPDPSAVLRGLQGRLRRAAAWRRRPLILAAAAPAAAVALALVLALLVPSGRPAQPALPSAKSVATVMLTSFHSVRGDVEYETQTGYSHGVRVDEYQSWTWPAQPVAGQRQLSRVRYSGTSPASTTMKLTEDRGTDVVNPPGITGETPGQVTMVCFAGSGQTGCGYGERDTRAGTWSRFTAPVPGGSDVGPGGAFSPSLLARGLTAGAWRVVGRAHVDGQPAIELKENGYRKGIPESLPGRLWVNAQTYLPIRLVFGGSVQDFRYLPPTPANLALLRVPIPAGYPRS
ncbi:MAG TPA: hypothetical protein VGI96_20740 [Streptosporangiaceae bacterium]|jgi:hypothetical protein